MLNSFFRCHQNLVRHFFISALAMLTTDGEIHVTHKTSFPFSEWKIVKIAQDVGLYLVSEERFSLLDYPGYENKRGAGICDQTFPVGMSSTFRFAKNYLYY
jgi:25S rRNA (uracil2634-N3)-methyltransferase